MGGNCDAVKWRYAIGTVNDARDGAGCGKEVIVFPRHDAVAAIGITGDTINSGISMSDLENAGIRPACLRQVVGNYRGIPGSVKSPEIAYVGTAHSTLLGYALSLVRIAIADEILSLPMFPELTEEEIQFTIQTVRDWPKRR